MKNYLLSLTILFYIPLFSQVSLNYYFPNETFDPNIPTPKSVIGHQVGHWHITYGKLVNYMRVLANASKRMILLEHGTTHEDRPLIALIISSQENIKRLEELNSAHLNFEQNAPIVLWQGYSIHGNEPSGSNASLLYAYYLASAQDQELKKELEHSIIILYPSFNPDGLNRFATWVNMHKNKTITTNSADREYNEVWPQGRTNHYWFDLNRDWLPLTQPESKAKVRLFHKWMPNVLTDHHEMGKDQTFFFQPGIPSRTHPLTPKINQKLTERIGKFHANALDKIGTLYYSKEQFDDFYYGKGSTFPDVQGCIGILFEQASSRGHAQYTENGLIEFPFTIRNQLITSISTLKASVELRNELKNYQTDVYRNKLKGGIEIGTVKDKTRLHLLAQLLDQHEIKYVISEKKKTIMGKQILQSIQVPYSQKKGVLARAMFDTRTTFTDSLFYDVSAFHFGQSHNLPYQSISRTSDDFQSLEFPMGKVFNPKAEYAFVFGWNQYFSPRAAYRLLKENIRLKVANKPFIINDQSFDRGAILIALQNQDKEKIRAIVQQIANQDGIDIVGFNSGYGQDIHLGSGQFKTIQTPKVALAVGKQVVSYDSGEVWHLLDVKYQIPVSKVDLTDQGVEVLDDFNVLVMPDGYYEFSKKEQKQLHQWVQKGGTLIGIEKANSFLSKSKLSKAKWETTKQDSTDIINYSELENYKAAKITGGAIVKVSIDKTNPLYYGYHQKTIPTFKRGNHWLKNDKDRYKNISKYDHKLLLNGYLHKKNRAAMSGKTNLQITANGKGRVISYVDNPVFRGFWLGTDKILANMIFFTPTINKKACL